MPLCPALAVLSDQIYIHKPALPIITELYKQLHVEPPTAIHMLTLRLSHASLLRSDRPTLHVKMQYMYHRSISHLRYRDTVGSIICEKHSEVAVPSVQAQPFGALHMC